jgi:CHASE2 domain-containing sensor protein
VKILLYLLSEAFDALVSRYPVVVAAVAASFIASALTLLGPLDHPSRMLDDLLIRHAPVSLPEPRVLIVEIPPEIIVALRHAEHSDNPDVVRDLTLAVRRLRDLGARQIAIDLLPAAASDLIADALQNDDVLFGRRFSPGSGMASERLVEGTLEELPDEYRPLSNRIGVLGIPELEFGVSRTQTLFVQVGNQVLPALESLLASRAGAKPTPVDHGPLRIDFRGGQHRLPTLDFERVVTGDLLLTLVENRAVLIGAGPDPFARGIVTPLTGDRALLSELHYRGHVLDSLLRESELTRSTTLSFALTAVAALLGAMLGQTISFRAAFSISCVASVGYMGAAWLSLGLLDLQLPLVELMTAQPLACFFVLATRHIEERRELRRAARRTTALVRALPEQPSRPSESNTAWHRLGELLKTSVGIERLMFFEVARDGETASEVYSEGCTIDSDRIHDLSDHPFPEIMRGNLVLELTQPFFEASSPRSVQFLLPLSDAGRWLGFCAAESAEYGPEQEEATLRALREIGPLAGRLLAEWLRSPSGDALPPSFASHEPARRASDGEARRLESNAEALYRRIGTLQKIVDDGSVASAVFDLSGFVLQSNARMQAIATEYGLSLADSRPSEFMAELTGFDLDRTRGMFRRILIEDRKHVIPVRPLGDGHTRTLHVSPLNRPAAEIEDPSRPFPLQGILVEIIDDEVAHQFHRHRARVAPIAQRAHLEISRLSETIDKLSRETGTDTTVMARLSRSAGEAVSALREGLANPPQPGDSNPALIEASGPLELATEQHSAECRQRDISVVFDRPERPVFVEAPEASFHDLLEASVSLLVRDATDSSTLILQLVELPDRIEYDLRNQGYGMPSNILRKGLSEIDDGSLTDLTRIRRALPDAESAGADFTIDSEVGEGISIKLVMPRAL